MKIQYWESYNHLFVIIEYRSKDYIKVKKYKLEITKEVFII